MNVLFIKFGEFLVLLFLQFEDMYFQRHLMLLYTLLFTVIQTTQQHWTAVHIM